MYASTMQSGSCTGTPDVCTTPTPTGDIPVTYSNLVNCPLAQDAAQSVYISGSQALTVKSNFATSNGNEAGVTGGVASGKIIGKVEYTSGSLTVKIEGSSAAYMNSVTAHNDNNAVGAQLAPSQTTVDIQS